MRQFVLGDFSSVLLDLGVNEGNLRSWRRGNYTTVRADTAGLAGGQTLTGGGAQIVLGLQVFELKYLRP
jgi:hypothetical protein